ELVGLQFDGLPPARLADSLAELLGPHALRPGLPLDRLCAELPPLLSELADLFDRLMPEPGRLPGPTVPAEPAWAHALAFGATAH
ncbi:MAG TPA: hypothetical protein VEH84_00675, partial [Alphaproteobacteria bacterium]|nr:hypothetical protein [Alphaproteobacteria bacterium]